MLERWDGKGAPQKLAGEEIALPVRLAEPATQAVIFHRLGGTEAAIAMAERRSGGMFDPRAVEALKEVGPNVLARLDEVDPWEALLEAEPTPAREVRPDRLDGVAEAFADMVDLKSTYTLGHSSEVADLAVAAAERLGLADPRTLRLAALFHDLGRTAVGTGVWEKPGPSPPRSGSGFGYTPTTPSGSSGGPRPSGRWRGSPAPRTGRRLRVPPGRVGRRALARGPRAGRRRRLPGDDPGSAPSPGPDARRGGRRVQGDLRAGRFDPECVRAVLEAAGRPSPKRGAWPAGLSDRVVDVLRLVSRELSNREIAEELMISPRTAEHHVQHIYAKIGSSTRAAAAMFAMERGLLRT